MKRGYDIQNYLLPLNASSVRLLVNVNSPAITEAMDPADFATARTLFREYAAALNVDLCFQNFAEELSHLEDMYSPPRRGCLLLLRQGGEAIGCVAIRNLDGTRCEMKRLYVKPQSRGFGFGKLLAHRAVERARELGYAQMVLDTLPAMTEAQSLYASLGFSETESYYPNPLSGARYLELALGTA